MMQAYQMRQVIYIRHQLVIDNHLPERQSLKYTEKLLNLFLCEFD